MKDIIYLKREEYRPNVLAFDPNQLVRVEIWQDRECRTQQFNNDVEYEFSITYDMEHGWTPISREEFNDVFIGFSKHINELSKEL